MVEFATDDTAWVVVETRLAGLSAATSLRWFTDAVKLNQW